jgi:hypothetical protein
MKSKQTIHIEEIKNWFEGSSDIVTKKRTYTGTANHSLEFLYCPNLVDMKYMNDVIFPNINAVMEKEGHFDIDLLSNVLEISKLKDGKM